jgi:purine-binding chemotaxis protein CheW
MKAGEMMSDTRPEIENGSFDWENVRRRFAAGDATLDDLDAAPLEVIQRIWARRAEQLAQVPHEEEEGGLIELVLVRLGSETYGLEAQYVSDIRPAEFITRVPRVPTWVAGVTNLRGRILSIVDLQRFFGLSRAEPRGLPSGKDEADDGGNGILVVVEGSEMELALLVDEVLVVEVMPLSRMQEPTDIIRGLAPEYVRGVAEQQDSAVAGVAASDGLLVVLDLPALLADERLVVDEDVV